MQIKEGYLLRQIKDDYVVMAYDEKLVNFNHIISVNETGAFLWRLLENEISYDELLSSFIKEYEVDVKIAKQDLDDFISLLQKNDFLR